MFMDPDSLHLGQELGLAGTADSPACGDVVWLTTCGFVYPDASTQLCIRETQWNLSLPIRIHHA